MISSFRDKIGDWLDFSENSQLVVCLGCKIITSRFGDKEFDGRESEVYDIIPLLVSDG